MVVQNSNPNINVAPPLLKNSRGGCLKMIQACDLFSGAGGAATGLHRAGFDHITGYDIEDQPRYPFTFCRQNALDVDLTGFDFVWASPPCQAHSRMAAVNVNEYECFIERTREKLIAWGGLYIIENVIGAPLRNPIMLCGAMFGMEMYRHRLFESNTSLAAPEHPKHKVPASKAGHWRPGTFISVAGTCAPIKMARKVMGIDWMNRDELAEAIPPVFSEYLGKQVVAELEKRGVK